MSINISAELANEILSGLGDCETSDKLRAVMASASSNVVSSVRVEVPILALPHVSQAMSVGAATAMLCDESVEVVRLMGDISRDLWRSFPPEFGVLLHRSDVSAAFDLLTSGFRAEHNVKRGNADIRLRRGEETRSFMLSRDAQRLMRADEAFADRVVSVMNDYGDLIRASVFTNADAPEDAP